jgi:hypothetical protein
MVHLDLEKPTTLKKIYVQNDDYVVAVGKIFTLYQRQMFKKIPGLGTFYTQSVKEGLTFKSF